MMTETGWVSQDLREKEVALQEELKRWPSLLVAFSGGVDSTFLMAAAYRALGAQAMAAMADSPSLPRQELEQAKGLAAARDWPLVILKTEELEDEAYVANPPNRCYFCKHHLFQKMSAYAQARGFAALAYGENVDDLADHRPSRPAAAEYAVLAPLQEAGLTKADIRSLSQMAGLPTAAKVAQPCLASRLPTGQRVTRNALAQIEAGEAMMRAEGLRVVRLRHRGEEAFLEVGPGNDWERFGQTDLRHRLARKLQTLGFIEVLFSESPYQGPSLR